MSEKKTRQTTVTREQVVRQTEVKVTERNLAKVSAIISNARNIAYHDKLAILRDIRDAFSESS